MRTPRPHILDLRETFLLHNAYAPKLALDRDFVPEIAKISSHSSLGFHPAAVVRLSSDEVIALTERYPSVTISCNGRNATSLFDVARDGGPALPAHELCLEIQGPVNMEQVRAIRRIRGILPELQKVEITNSHVILHHTDLEKRIPHVDSQTIIGMCTKSFSKDREVIFVEDIRSLEEIVTLSDLDRLSLRELSHMAWAEQKKQPQGAPKRLPQDDPLYKHVQTALFDIPDGVATLIEQGPAVKDSRSTWRVDDRWPVSVCSTRLDGQIWHDSARSAVMRMGITPESVRISARGHDLFITALLPEGDSGSFGKSRGPSEFPFSTRFWGISNEDRLTRDFFELLPHHWNFRGLKESPCKRMVLLNADALGQSSLSGPEHRLLVDRTQRTVLYSHNRFSPISFEDARVREILAHIPFCVELLKVQQCRVTNDILLHTTNEIPASILQYLQEDLRHSVINTVTQARVPSCIKEPAAIISQGRMTPAKLTPISDDNIRTLTVIGGANDIGGSSLRLGNILLDCGAFPKNARHGKGFVSSQASQLHGIEAALFTHGHLDHIGNGPQLASHDIPILMHHATPLISWPLLSEQIGTDTGFGIRDRNVFYEKILPVPFDYRVSLSPTISATLIQAGHMVGSAMVVIEHTDPSGTWRAMYTGDLQRDNSTDNHRVYPPARAVSDIDVLIIEATNGMAPVAPRADLELQLIKSIQESLDRGGRVILPAIASRVPELLTLFVKYRKDIKAQIFLDGPALLSSISIHSYLSHRSPDLFIQQSRQEQGWHGIDSGFFGEAKRAANKRFLEDKTPRVVITSGGMGQGIAERYIKAARANDTVIFTCYQGQGSFGRSFLDKYQAAMRDNPTTWKGPRALTQRLSGHISGEQLLKFVKETLKPAGTVVLLHGGDNEKIAVKAALTKQNHAGKIIIARAGEKLEL